jgi:hypothetical protein
MKPTKHTVIKIIAALVCIMTLQIQAMDSHVQEICTATYKRKKVESVSTTTESKPVEQDHHTTLAEKVSSLLYEILDPMPQDLINIIMKYYLYEFEGKQVKTIQHNKYIDFLVPLSRTLLALSSKFSGITIKNIETDKTIRTIPTNRFMLRALIALSENILVGATAEGTAEAWNTDTGNNIKSFVVDKHPDPKASACIARISKTAFAIRAEDASIKIFDINKDESLSQTAGIICASFIAIPDTNILAITTLYGIQFYDWKKRQWAFQHMPDVFYPSISLIVPRSHDSIIIVQEYSDAISQEIRSIISVIKLGNQNKIVRYHQLPTAITACNLIQKNHIIAALDNKTGVYLNLETEKMKSFPLEDKIGQTATSEHGYLATSSGRTVKIWR